MLERGVVSGISRFVSCGRHRITTFRFDSEVAKFGVSMQKTSSNVICKLYETSAKWSCFFEMIFDPVSFERQGFNTRAD